jgi:membrane protease YdiL (CAAX protease family)
VDWLGIVVYLVAMLCGVVAVGHWRRTQTPLWQGMGLRLDRRAWVDLGAGIAIGGLVMGGIFAVEWAWGALHVDGVRLPDRSLVTWLLVLAFLAFWEEFFFRSLMLSGLVVLVRRRWLAVMVMAAFFGLAHASNPNASALSVLGNALGGLMYAVAFLGRGRIWLPAGLHFAWNFFQGPVLGFPVSGLDMGGLVQQSPVGSDLLTGGSYGPEAGLVGTAFRFVAIALLVALRLGSGQALRLGSGQALRLGSGQARRSEVEQPRGEDSSGGSGGIA